ncbi:MAG: FHA domain-containing protein [Lachnospiraceae bacterium]|nr:FHA domain-containing protein [Lachnospiraceae bacterium]
MSRRIEDDLIDIGLLDVSLKVNKTEDLERITEGISKRTVKKIKERPNEEVKFSEEPKPIIEEEDSGALEEKPPIREEGVQRKPVTDMEEEVQRKPESKVQRVERKNPYEEEEATSYLYDEKGERAMLKNPATGECFVIMEFPFSIGKRIENDMCIPDNTVSRYHAEISEKDHRLFIKDLKSLNGTFVNGRKVAPMTEMELKDGQEIMLANKKFVFHRRGK